MSKKVLLVVLLVLILAVPATAYAYEKAVPPTAKMVYRVDAESWDITVSKFKDGKATCYVAAPAFRRDTKPSISCVVETQ